MSGNRRKTSYEHLNPTKERDIFSIVTMYLLSHSKGHTVFHTKWFDKVLSNGWTRGLIKWLDKEEVAASSKFTPNTASRLAVVRSLADSDRLFLILEGLDI